MPAGFREVGVDELYAQLHSPADAGATERAAGAGAEDAPAVLDVRTRGEFAGGRVPGAVNVPLDELSDAVRSGRLDDMRGRPVAVVCAIGKRSAQVRPPPSRPVAFLAILMLTCAV